MADSKLRDLSTDFAVKENQLLKGTIIRTIFVFVELVALVIISIIALSSSGESAWGYWGAVAIVFVTLSPIYIYVTASTIFNIFNTVAVFNKRHTTSSIRKYYTLTKLYFIWGIITGGLYGGLLVPIFLLENIFLFVGYKKACNINRQSCV